MNPDNSQAPMSPEDAKASLGIATHLQDQLMPQAPPEQPQEQQPQEDAVTPRVDELEKKFNDLQKEVKDTIKEELGGIKNMIKEVLTEDNQQDGGKE